MDKFWLYYVGYSGKELAVYRRHRFERRTQIWHVRAWWECADTISPINGSNAYDSLEDLVENESHKFPEPLTEII